MSQAARPATYVEHASTPPSLHEADGAETWFTRGANFIVAMTKAKSGTRLTRADNPDEYMLMLPPGVNAKVTAGGESITADGDSLTIIPPGPSSIELTAGGYMARLFSNKATDLLEQATNASLYADGAPEAKPLVAWPDPVGGFKLRHYKLQDHFNPNGERIQPRLFRSTNLMVNMFAPFYTRRPTDALSPHWHDDFEQGSLSFAGTWIHHLRYPWTPDLSEWRDDEHMTVGGPSITIIPSTVVHTSRDIGEGLVSLVDIFSPPRADFSRKPGFVLNSADYPMPDLGDDGEPVTKGALMAWQKPA